MEDTEGTEYGSVCDIADSRDTALGNLNFVLPSPIPTIPVQLIVIAQNILIRAYMLKAAGIPTIT